MMMTSDVTLSISLIILLIGCFINIYNFVGSRKKDIKTEDKMLEELKEGILKLNFKTDQICSTTNETRTDIKSMKADIDSVREELIVQKQETKSIWKRIDEISKQLESK